MGFFSSKEPEVQVLGSCFVCGTEVIRDKGEHFGFLLSDGNCICSICSEQKRLPICRQSTKEYLLEKIKENVFLTPDEFCPTKRIIKKIVVLGSVVSVEESFVEIDETRELIVIPEIKTAIFSKDKRIEHLRKFKDLIDFELLSNGTKLTDGNSLLGAAVGGAVFGGFGAIVGAGSRSKSTTDICKTMSVKLIFNNLQKPTEYINIITSDLKTNSSAYQQMYNVAQECLSLLTIILKKNQSSIVETNYMKVAPPVSATDEIKKYKELLDIGAITEEEFSSKKKQLLGL